MKRATVRRLVVLAAVVGISPMVFEIIPRTIQLEDYGWTAAFSIVYTLLMILAIMLLRLKD